MSFVDSSDGVPAHEVASQALELRGRSEEAVLGVVGQLQSLVLAIGDLGWQVPQDQADAAGRKARIEALSALRDEAVAAVQTLSLMVQGYQSIDLTGGPVPIFNPCAGGGAIQMAASLPPSLATADSQNISATVSADVIIIMITEREREHP